MNEYIPSIFNNIIECEDGTMKLYNSYTGTANKAMLKICSDKKGKILSLLDSLNNKKMELSDPDVKVLFEKGFLVDKKLDEEKLMELRYNEVINTPELFLVILPTEQCNFRCKYCYENFKKGSMSDETIKSIIKFVRKNMNNYTRLTVSWFGGEPLVAKDVIFHLSKEFMEICRVSKKLYRASITTNGYLLDYTLFKMLNRFNVTSYQISIDGYKNNHDKLRVLANGQGTFDRITSNLLEIKSNLKNRDKCVFWLRTNYTKEILNELDEYINFYEENFGNDNRFLMMVQQAGDWGGERVDNIRKQLLPSEQYGIIMNQIRKKSNKIDFSKQADFIEPGMATCYAARKNAYVIGSDATVYKCTEDFENPDNKIGFINSNGEMVIDKILEYRWVLAKNKKDIKNCKKCSLGGYCLYGTCPRNYGCPKEKQALPSIIKALKDELFFEVK